MLLMLGTAGLSRSARADGDCAPRDHLSTCLLADNLWPQPGDGRWFDQAPTSVAGPGATSFGLVLSFVHRPLGLQIASPDPEGTTVYAVEDALTAVVLGAVGVADRLQLQLAAPMVLLQSGAGKSDVVGSEERLPRSAAGDLRFGVALAPLQRDPRDDGPALAARFEMTAPTGDERAFASSSGASYAPGLSFDYRLGRLALGADASARFRREIDFADLTIGSQLGGALGVGFDVLDDSWLSTNLEAFALFTLAAQRQRVTSPGQFDPSEQPAPPHIPAEWLLSVRSAHLLDGKLSLSAGAGSFIPTGEQVPATAPALRVVAAVRYIPEHTPRRSPGRTASSLRRRAEAR